MTLRILILLGFLTCFFSILNAGTNSNFSGKIKQKDIKPFSDSTLIKPSADTIGVYISKSSISITVSVTNLNSTLPDRFSLSQNHPNPFNSSTIIEYTLPERTWAKLEIFNILGQRVVALVDAEQVAGFYRIIWDGKNTSGKNVASGVYFYRIIANNYTSAKKMLLLQ